MSEAIDPLFIRPEGCICPMFRDTGGFRIADLTCPVHGVHGTDPGDGQWLPGHCVACGSADIFYDTTGGWSCRSCHRTDADE
jgi:hypothetical protein